MKYIFRPALSFAILLCGCDHLKKHFSGGKKEKDKKIMLTTGVVNTVTMKDTMVIYEGACRGCAYEQSTHFDIVDPAGIVALDHVITTDNNPDDMDGGNVSKDLVIVPKKPGVTTIKMYKFSKTIPEAQDSLHFSEYKIEIRN